MTRLEDISKKQPFEVPEGYFNELPMKIQARIAEKPTTPAFSGYGRFALQYALPAVLLLVVAFFVFRPAPEKSAEELLATVETEALVAYVVNSDMTIDEIIQQASFDTESVEAIEEEAYFNFDDLDLDESYFEDIELDTNSNP